MSTVKKINLALATLACLMLLIILGVALWRWTNPSPIGGERVANGSAATHAATTAHANAMPGAGGATVPPPPEPHAIKVGWMVSAYTSDEHPYSPKGTMAAFDSVSAMRKRLLDPEIDYYAILEPNTATEGRMPDILHKYFRPDRTIDGTDATALSKLDVIICSRDWNMRPAVMAAILKAVNNGTGLLRHLATGIRQNDDDAADVATINCIDDPQFFWTRDETACTVVSDHPLLAGIRTTLEGGKISIGNVNGCLGIVHGTPLIVADDGSQDSHGLIAQGLPTTAPIATTAPADRKIFCPMFVSQIGKGKVVVCQWDSIPRELVEATNGRFYIRCVEWLANRPLK